MIGGFGLPAAGCSEACTIPEPPFAERARTLMHLGRTGSLSTQQAAPCWLVLSNDERFAFVANAASGSIGGFALSPGGVLTPLSSDGRTGVRNGSGATPRVLQTGTGTVGTFAIGAKGSLTTLPDTPGLAPVAGDVGHPARRQSGARRPSECFW